MNYYDLIELDDYQEDVQAIQEICFDVEPYWNMELDLEYAQGEM